MDLTLNQRVRDIINFYGLSNYALSKKMGMDRSDILNNIVNDKTTVSSKAITHILQALPDVSPDWLLFGKGTMMRAPKNRSMAKQTQMNENINTNINRNENTSMGGPGMAGSSEKVEMLEQKIEFQKETIEMQREIIDNLKQNIAAYKEQINVLKGS